MKRLLTLLLMLGIFLSPALAQQSGTYQSYYNKGTALYNEANGLYKKRNAGYKAKCNQAINYFKLAKGKTKVQAQINACNSMISKCQKLRDKPIPVPVPPVPDPPLNEDKIPDYEAITVTDIEFANADEDGELLSEYGSVITTNTQYLKAKIHFKNNVRKARNHIDIRVKLYEPGGKLSTASHDTYTFDDYLRADGDYKSNDFDYTIGWGNKSGSSYVAGDYRYEVWIASTLMFSKNFTVYRASSSGSGSGGSRLDNDNSSTRARGMQDDSWRRILARTVENPSRTFGSSPGDPYKGGLYNNDCQGFGMYEWRESQSFYFGKWNDGERNGYGVHVCGPNYYVCGKNDAAIYVGNYDNGSVADGKKATLYDERGNLLYYGTIENGQPAGAYPSTGNWNEFKFECIECGDGNYYIGETYKGDRHGFGIYIWKNKDFWIGYWSNDKRKGSGMYVYYNGNVQTGTWDGDTRTE